MTRQQQIDLITDRPELQVLIVGGGINGVGVLRELALQGLNVLLVEKSDFCSGASAASSRIIHGGLRYLENAEFRLVKEALNERNRLLNNAPHYVHPLPTTIPIIKWTGGLFASARKFLGFSAPPQERGALTFKIGLAIYDRFAGRQSPLPRHRFASRRASLALRPELDPGIVCTATYYDASISSPERLGLELVLDAERQCSGVNALNYVCVTGAEGNAVFLHDEVSGRVFTVKPEIVINASGPWIDFTNHYLQRKTAYIAGTKGSHLVIDHPRLLRATQGQMLYFDNADGRLCLLYPVDGKVIAGTTDVPVSDPETALCGDEEIDYIMGSVRRIFPAIPVDRRHIVYKFCGVRPLPRSDAATPGEISRDHVCALLPPQDGIKFPIYSLIGGKLTTFRAFAEQVADKVLEMLGAPRQVDSANVEIGGGRNFPRGDAAKQEWLAALSEKSCRPPEQLAVWLDRYGTRAAEVASFAAGSPDEPLRALDTYTKREILFLAQQEKIIHLDDLILRRTMLALLGQVTFDLLVELAEVLAPDLDWSAETSRQEVQRTAKVLEKVHGLKL